MQKIKLKEPIENLWHKLLYVNVNNHRRYVDSKFNESIPLVNIGIFDILETEVRTIGFIIEEDIRPVKNKATDNQYENAYEKL